MFPGGVWAHTVQSLTGKTESVQHSQALAGQILHVQSFANDSTGVQCLRLPEFPLTQHTSWLLVPGAWGRKHPCRGGESEAGSEGAAEGAGQPGTGIRPP